MEHQSKKTIETELQGGQNAVPRSNLQQSLINNETLTEPKSGSDKDTIKKTSSEPGFVKKEFGSKGYILHDRTPKTSLFYSFGKRESIVPATDVKMRPLLYHKVISTPIKLTALTRKGYEASDPNSLNVGKTSYCFSLEKNLVNHILNSRSPSFGSFGTQVLVRFCLKDDNGVIYQDTIPECIMYVNGHFAKVQQKNSTLQEYMDITKLCNFKEGRKSKDVLSVEWMTNKKMKFYISVCVAEKLSIPDIVSKWLVENVKDPSFSKIMIQDKLKSDTDVSCTSLKASLICPLAKTRIVSPCRGQNCTHIQCVDALTLLKLNEGRPLLGRKCYMCDQPAGNIYIDGLFLEILKSVPNTVEEVEFTQDGSWTYLGKDSTSSVENCKEEPALTQREPALALPFVKTEDEVYDLEEKKLLDMMKARFSSIRSQVEKLDLLSRQHEKLNVNTTVEEGTSQEDVRDCVVIDLSEAEDKTSVTLEKQRKTCFITGKQKQQMKNETQKQEVAQNDGEKERLLENEISRMLQDVKNSSIQMTESFAEDISKSYRQHVLNEAKNVQKHCGVGQETSIDTEIVSMLCTVNKSAEKRSQNESEKATRQHNEGVKDKVNNTVKTEKHEQSPLKNMSEKESEMKRKEPESQRSKSADDENSRLDQGIVLYQLKTDGTILTELNAQEMPNYSQDSNVTDVDKTRKSNGKKRKLIIDREMELPGGQYQVSAYVNTLNRQNKEKHNHELAPSTKKLMKMAEAGLLQDSNSKVIRKHDYSYIGEEFLRNPARPLQSQALLNLFSKKLPWNIQKERKCFETQSQPCPDDIDLDKETEGDKPVEEIVLNSDSIVDNDSIEETKAMIESESKEQFDKICDDEDENNSKNETTGYPCENDNDKIILEETHTVTTEDRQKKQCPHCEKTFRCKRTFNSHVYSHTGKKPLVCKVNGCKQGFLSKFTHDHHQKLLADPHMFMCFYCDKNFHRIYHLKEHLKTHDANMTVWRCDLCKKEFWHCFPYRTHMAMHAADRDKTFTCAFCQKSFDHKWQYHNHLKLRSGYKISTFCDEKCYKCFDCELNFLDAKDLNRHMLTHAITKAFPCQLCEAKFYSEEDMLLHVESKHLGSNKVKNETCYEAVELQSATSLPYVRTLTKLPSKVKPVEVLVPLSMVSPNQLLQGQPKREEPEASITEAVSVQVQTQRSGTNIAACGYNSIKPAQTEYSVQHNSSSRKKTDKTSHQLRNSQPEKALVQLVLVLPNGVHRPMGEQLKSNLRSAKVDNQKSRDQQQDPYRAKGIKSRQKNTEQKPTSKRYSALPDKMKTRSTWPRKTKACSVSLCKMVTCSAVPSEVKNHSVSPSKMKAPLVLPSKKRTCPASPSNVENCQTDKTGHWLRNSQPEQALVLQALVLPNGVHKRTGEQLKSNLRSAKVDNQKSRHQQQDSNRAKGIKSRQENTEQKLTSKIYSALPDKMKTRSTSPLKIKDCSVSLCKMGTCSAVPSKVQNYSVSPGKMKVPSVLPSNMENCSASPTKMKTRSTLLGNMKNTSASHTKMKICSTLVANIKTLSASATKMKTRSALLGSMKTRSASSTKMKTSSKLLGNVKTLSASPTKMKIHSSLPGNIRTHSVFHGSTRTRYTLPGKMKTRGVKFTLQRPMKAV